MVVAVMVDTRHTLTTQYAHGCLVVSSLPSIVLVVMVMVVVVGGDLGIMLPSQVKWTQVKSNGVKSSQIESSRIESSRLGGECLRTTANTNDELHLPRHRQSQTTLP